MTESVGNETIEKYWCFLPRNWALTGFFSLKSTLKTFFGYAGYVYAINKNEPFDGKFQICQISLLPTDSVSLDHAV
jgi:hypothetical protein